MFLVSVLTLSGIYSAVFLNRTTILKQLIPVIFPIAAGIWLFYRYTNQSLTGTLIVESLALAGISFFFKINLKEEGYRLVISSVLLIYGAVMNQPLFIYLSVPAVILIFLLLHFSRTEALCKKPEHLVKPYKYGNEYRYLMLHILLTFIFGTYIFSLFSSHDISESLKNNTNKTKITEIDKRKNDSGDEISNNIKKIEPPSSDKSESLFIDSGLNENEVFKESPEFKQNLISTHKKIKQKLSSLLNVIKGPVGYTLLFIILILILISFTFSYLRKYISKIGTRKNCTKLYLKAEKNLESNPSLSLKLSYLSLRTLLAEAGFPKKNNLELFDYGESFKSIDPAFSHNVLLIFSLYSKMVYSTSVATADESRKAFQSLSELRKVLLINIKKGVN